MSCYRNPNLPLEVERKRPMWSEIEEKKDMVDNEVDMLDLTLCSLLLYTKQSGCVCAQKDE